MDIDRMYPHLKFEENRRALERERRLRQQIRAAGAAQRPERPSRMAVTARLRRALRPDPCPPLVEEC